MSKPNFPRKVRELQNHHFDSTIWEDFVFRDGDIIIASYAKSGSTWLQQIIAQLLFDGEANLKVAEMSPWLDLRIPPKETKLSRLEAQTHRRFIKTHLPTDALVFSDRAKYIFIGRDGRDVLWSLYNHHVKANTAWYTGLNKTPGRVGAPIEKPHASIKHYYHAWLDEDGYPFWPFWENIRSWWSIRSLSNVYMMHFANLKCDLPGQIRKIAKFLSISINEDKWASILLHSSFDYMQKNAAKSVPFNGVLWEDGVRSFIHKGTNRQWSGILERDDIEKYEHRATAELGGECARWLATGNLPDKK